MPATLFRPLEAGSKKDRIVASMRQAIVTGALAPGDLLAEAKVARQFGVGQPIVREALIELEHQGFVTRLPYRGTSVTKLSRDDIEQIFRLRAELEPLGMEWAKQAVTKDDIAALRAHADGMRRAAEAVDLGAFYEHDLAFHRKIWDLSGNRYLAQALERLVVPLFAFFLMKTSRDQATYIESAAKHGRLVGALESAEATDVGRLMGDSLAEFRDYWDAQLAE